VARDRRGGFADALAVREFRALWAAEAQSVVGDQLAKVALSVMVYSRTGSVGLTALSYAALLLPTMIAGPLLSGLADAYPRRSVLVVCAAVQAVLVALMAAPATPLAAVFGLVVVMQFAQAPFMAAQAAVLPAVLSGEAYQAGQALRQITRQVGTLVGLAFAGMAVATVGVSTALMIDAATFVLAAAVIRYCIGPHAAAAGPDTKHGSGMVHGAALIWHDPRLRSLVAMIWLAGFAVVPEALMVPFAISVGAGPAAVGWLLAVESAAMVLGAFLLVRLVPLDTRLRLLPALALLTLAPLVAYVTRPGLAGALVLLALSGLFAAYQVTASATFMELVPDARRGQAYGLARTGLIAAQGLGVLAGGVVAELTGSVSATIALAGAAGMLVAIPAAITWQHAHARQHALG